jgi:hypothetical protein
VSCIDISLTRPHSIQHEMTKTRYPELGDLSTITASVRPCISRSTSMMCFHLLLPGDVKYMTRRYSLKGGRDVEQS